ncbi:hypothetical protein ZWY2020_014752 [Hordeum vulgare]|nr:hypothetical protein ZWY2020_014752 [Hordeum vulgare]
MMAIDTCFLLDFLESYHVDVAIDMVSSATNWINAMVRDPMMLENQIPLFLFAGALQLRHASEEAAANAMHAVLDRFIRDVCPIKTTALAIAGDIAKHAATGALPLSRARRRFRRRAELRRWSQRRSFLDAPSSRSRTTR